MARPRKQPEYDDGRTYPARDAQSARDLMPYLAKVRRVLDGVEAALDDPSLDDRGRTIALLRAARLGRGQMEDLAHLSAELAMREGFSMKATGEHLGLNPDTPYRWWHSPLAQDQLTAEWQDPSDGVATRSVRDGE